jgi:Tol biopolymer transport system component
MLAKARFGIRGPERLRLETGETCSSEIRDSMGWSHSVISAKLVPAKLVPAKLVPAKLVPAKAGSREQGTGSRERESSFLAAGGGEEAFRQTFRRFETFGRFTTVKTGFALMRCVYFIAIILGILSAACTKSTGPESVHISDPLDPGIIVFLSDRETNARRQLFLMNSDGSDPVRITHDSNDYRRPLFSPDGLKILFYSHTSDHSDEIFVMDVDGDNVVNLSGTPGDDHLPSYSPDGSKIVFTSSRDGNPEIYIMDSDGQNQTRLTFDERVDGAPQFAGNGSKILYYSFEPQERTYSINLIDIDGSNKQCLTGDEPYYQNQAFLSSRVFNASDVMPFDIQSYNYLIFMMDFDGRHHRLLADAPGYNVAPVFAPDGQKIIFRSNRAGRYDLYEMGLAGEAQRNLSRGPGHAYFSQFVQGGSKILFYTDREYYHKIWLMNSDGSGQIQLTYGDYNDYEPRFQPLAE